MIYTCMYMHMDIIMGDYGEGVWNIMECDYGYMKPWDMNIYESGYPII